MHRKNSDLPHLAFQEYGASLQALQRAREALEEMEAKVRDAFTVFKGCTVPEPSPAAPEKVRALVDAHAQCQRSLMEATMEARQKFLVWLILRGEASTRAKAA